MAKIQLFSERKEIFHRNVISTRLLHFLGNVVGSCCEYLGFTLAWHGNGGCATLWNGELPYP
jgi:hypothetical protein